MRCSRTVRLKTAGGLNRLLLFFIICALSFTGRCASAFAQTHAGTKTSGGRDSVVRLLDAQAAELQDIGGMAFRKVQGPARFLHNNTYLLCDSAVWDVFNNVIDAIGHVQLIQETTYLVGDRLTYLANENLAQFRGELVKLYNKKGDELKTRYLDYNTKDSVAVFYNGGALRDKSGDIVEGDSGYYHADERVFSFKQNVQMYSDSVYVTSDELDYYSPSEKAVFGKNTVAWKGRDTLFADSGDYDKKTGILSLKENNYVATQDQEVTALLMEYFKSTGNSELFGDVQIRDNAQSAVLMGEFGKYRRNPMVAFLTDKPVAAMYSAEKTGTDSLTNQPIIKRDTMFLAGDSLIFRLEKRCDVDTNIVNQAAERRMLADRDPMVEIDSMNVAYRAAYMRNKDKIGKLENPYSYKLSSSARSDERSDRSSGNDAPPEPAGKNLSGSKKPGPKNVKENVREGQEVVIDSAVLARDSIKAAEALKAEAFAKRKKDSIAALPKDTTKITFLNVHHHVKIYRSDLRAVCDSLVYTALDSIARFYKDPAMWNEDKNQFTADSIQMSVRNNAVYKANLIENAFIISQEDTVHYDQVKSTEMVAYFKENDVYRFDALGGASAVMFLKEKDSVITLMNQKECKILSAHIIDRKIQRIKYVEQLKSDVRPTYKLPVDQQRLRNFNWRIAEMPRSRFELTERKVRPSQRTDGNKSFLKEKKFPAYPQTRIYYPQSYEKITSIARSVNSRIEKENAQNLEKRQK